MSSEELEAEALKLPEHERSKLAELLLASLDHESLPEDDSILGLGTTPVSTRVLDGAGRHDQHLYGPGEA